ncbi:adenosine deaminase [bacterium]|nr:adenosine deaminase [bacterium]
MFAQIPKAELHIHLEGTISPETLLTLIKKNKIQTEIQTLKDVEKLFSYENFMDFLKAFIFVSNCIKTEKDFELITSKMLEELVKQNIVYVEPIFSPPLFVYQKNLDYFKILENINLAYEKFKNKITMNLLIDLVRNCGEELGFKTLELALKSRKFGVVGINLGGDESNFPASIFEKHFLKAKNEGLKTCCHAGEWSDFESVKTAVTKLKVDRIGHGIRSVENEKFLDFLAEKQIPLEVCPTSNLKTQTVSSYENHPIRKLYDKGVKITLNSDDPTFFGSNLNNEFEILLQKGIFNQTELLEILENGFKFAFGKPENL